MLFHYGFGYQEVLDLPLRVFWLLNNNIRRLLAERDVRSLNNAMGAQSADGYEKRMKELTIDLGEPVKIDEEARLKSETFDKEGLEYLRNIG